MRRVITYGTFDLLHYGHINLLRRAKALGDYLIVALSTDGFNWRDKFDFMGDLCEVVYLEHTPEISTTRIRSDLGEKA